MPRLLEGHQKGLDGFFNAITEKTYATVEDTISGETSEKLIEPLSNYNVLVLNQVLKNNSYITFTNTNVSRWETLKMQMSKTSNPNRYKRKSLYTIWRYSI